MGEFGVLPREILSIKHLNFLHCGEIICIFFFLFLHQFMVKVLCYFYVYIGGYKYTLRGMCPLHYPPPLSNCNQDFVTKSVDMQRCFKQRRYEDKIQD